MNDPGFVPGRPGPAGEGNGAPLPNGAPGATSRDLFDFAPEAQLVTDPAGLIQEANHAAATLLGARRELLLGKPVPLLVCEDRRQAFYALLVQLRKGGGGTRDWPVRVRPRRGEAIDVLLGATAVTGEEGGMKAVHWVLREGALLAGARRALRAERGFSDHLLDTARAFVLVLDRGGRPRRASPYRREATGHDEEGLRTLGWEVLFPPEDRPAAREALRPALEQALPANYTGPLLARDGGRLAAAWAV